MWRRGAARPWLVAFLLAAAAPSLGAQSVVDRTPNLDDGWTVRPGVVQFNFLHRFEVSPPPARKVTSFPNFHLATGLPLECEPSARLRDQLHRLHWYSERVSACAPSADPPANPRQSSRPDRSRAGTTLLRRASTVRSALARWIGPVRLLGAVRGFSSGYDVQRSLWGAGAGAVVRVTSWLSLTGDVFGLANNPDAAPGVTAWGAGAAATGSLQPALVLDPGHQHAERVARGVVARRARRAHGGDSSSPSPSRCLAISGTGQSLRRGGPDYGR